MDDRALVICDREGRYAEALARYIMKTKELSVQVQICSDLEQVIQLQEKMDIMYLFLSDEHTLEERSRLKAAFIFILTDGSIPHTQENEQILYKYQAGRKLISAVMQHYPEGDFNGAKIPYSAKENKKVIGVLTFGERKDRRHYTRNLCENLAKTDNVLYMDTEPFGETEYSDENEYLTLSDLIYYIRQEQGNIGALLADKVYRGSWFDSICPPSVSEDVKQMSGDEWKMLLERLLTESLYQNVVIEVEENMIGFYALLEICSEIRLLVTPDENALSRQRKFEKEIIILGKEFIRKRLVICQ